MAKAFARQLSCEGIDTYKSSVKQGSLKPRRKPRRNSKKKEIAKNVLLLHKDITGLKALIKP